MPSYDPALYDESGLPKITMPDGWHYSAVLDQMRGGDTQYADLSSDNSIFLSESDETHLFVQLARAKGEGISAGLYLDPTGKFACSGVCDLPASIDGRRDTIRGYSRGALDPMSEWFHVYDGEGLARKLRTAKRLIVEVQIAEHGTEQFKFDVAGLQWEFPRSAGWQPYSDPRDAGPGVTPEDIQTAPAQAFAAAAIPASAAPDQTGPNSAALKQKVR